MSAEARSYLDSSALVKMVLAEIESPALAAHLAARPRRVSCGLANVEVVRAVRGDGAAAVARARQLVARIEVLELDEPLLRAAADIEDTAMRSLDAIHVAAALSIGEDLDELITYDRRMARAAADHGLAVVAPA